MNKGYSIHYASDGEWTGDWFNTESEARAFVRAMKERDHWRYREPLAVRPVIERDHWARAA